MTVEPSSEVVVSTFFKPLPSCPSRPLVTEYSVTVPSVSLISYTSTLSSDDIFLIDAIPTPSIPSALIPVSTEPTYQLPFSPIEGIIASMLSLLPPVNCKIQSSNSKGSELFLEYRS